MAGSVADRGRWEEQGKRNERQGGRNGRVVGGAGGAQGTGGEQGTGSVGVDGPARQREWRSPSRTRRSPLGTVRVGVASHTPPAPTAQAQTESKQQKKKTSKNASGSALSRKEPDGWLPPHRDRREMKEQAVTQQRERSLVEEGGRGGGRWSPRRLPTVDGPALAHPPPPQSRRARACAAGHLANSGGVTGAERRGDTYASRPPPTDTSGRGRTTHAERAWDAVWVPPPRPRKRRQQLRRSQWDVDPVRAAAHRWSHAKKKVKKVPAPELEAGRSGDWRDTCGSISITTTLSYN